MIQTVQSPNGLLKLLVLNSLYVSTSNTLNIRGVLEFALDIPRIRGILRYFKMPRVQILVVILRIFFTYSNY